MPEQKPQSKQNEAILPQEQSHSFFDNARLRFGTLGATAAIAFSGAASENVAQGGEEPPVEPPTTPMSFDECASKTKRAKIEFDMGGYKLNFVGGYQTVFSNKKLSVEVPSMPENCEGKRQTTTSVMRQIAKDPKKAVLTFRSEGNGSNTKKDTARYSFGKIVCDSAKDYANFDVVHKAIYTDRTLNRKSHTTETRYKQAFRYSC
jgi:hypothetical protein